MVVAFVRPWLPVTVLKEHLNASPQQILPAWTHRRTQRVLVDLDQFTCREERKEDRWKGGSKERQKRDESNMFMGKNKINIPTCGSFCDCLEGTQLLT